MAPTENYSQSGVPIRIFEGKLQVEPVSQHHPITPLIRDALRYILNCAPLLKNYAENSLPKGSGPSSVSQRAQEIKAYLQHHPPDIFLVPMGPTISYGETAVEVSEHTPEGKTARYVLTRLEGRQQTSRQSFFNRQIVEAFVELNGEVKEIEESRKNLVPGYFPEKDKERLLKAIIVVTFVHEIAHVIHATFADMPTPEQIARRPEKDFAYDTNGDRFQMGESGDYAENVLSGGKGEFFAAYGEDGDYMSISHIVLGEGNEEIIVSGDDPALTNLLEGRWDPAPVFSPTTLTTTGTMKKNKASSSMMGSNHGSLLESMMVPVGENNARLPESPVTPCPRPTRRIRERYGMRNGMMVVR